MYGSGYRCDRCALGWHSSPSCPTSPGARYAPTIHEVQRQVHALNRVGGSADRRGRISGPLPEIPPPLGFRWWWIPVGLVVFVVLVILV